ncbi:unnamed protein product [Prunus armeniaca]|uniref:RNase H type-1 domain-containing protein n=1 Tax=Prunus armeniaca TaxID=36596 RepID=A0A6J5WI64_PRUAR|nr:unnamed protein product [Prunus armeniaca]
MAEALAIREAINASWTVGFKEIVIESDSKEIITMLRKEKVVTDCGGGKHCARHLDDSGSAGSSHLYAH